MSPSAHTPRHSRGSSIVDSTQGSPQARRRSESLAHDAATLVPNHNCRGEAGAGNGMGTLADELADAFSESGDEGVDESSDENIPSGVAHGRRVSRDSGRLVNSASSGRSHDAPQPRPQGNEAQYSGIDYGAESDVDSPEVSQTLVAKINTIESLAGRWTETHGDPADNSRQLHSLAFSVLSPLAAPLDAETIDDILPLLLSLSDDMPRPSTSAFNSLMALHSVTSELIQTLSCLSDTLHMSRQTTATATRRLKSAKELVSEMRRDAELRKEGERWLTRGNWGKRLQNRECAGLCGEVINGFEDVCDGWRQRLLAQAKSPA